MPSGRPVGTSSVRPDIAAYLAANPGEVLERVAAKFSASTLDVLRALSASDRTLVGCEHFDAIMADLTTWGEVLLIVHTPNIVLECKGVIPSGSHSHGYFNIHGDGPIGGHIKADRCDAIAFVARNFMGRASCSVQFFDKDGDAMFKVFVRRDENREMLADQVTKFSDLRSSFAS
ncbi:MAG: heme utilization cystosolic carrier protein HutX [Pseudomonadota bacterium]